MSKEALQKLVKYQGELKNKMDSKDLPAKHVNREASYRQFLAREFEAVSKKVEFLKMNDSSKK